ncbi:cyclase family protein [Zymobacter palmae]|uniref:Predicted metal-dependen thydrolase n=1 Tax=Zymobacter palmae TaxID=33074 RepID=A0A348HFL0_9GAMM|nr:cyclase family protein [Zymobacter palmae]BBG30412.1 predicted metal-dependen thydrolase [Zymobacter palmae]
MATTNSNAASLAQAVQFLKSCKWVDLTHEVTSSSPIFAAFNPPQRKTLFTVEKDGFLAYEISLCTPTGTHVDAPAHFINNAPLLNEINIKDLLLPMHVIHKEAQVINNHDYKLSVDDIIEYETQHGRIQEGSFVAFSSGWSQRWDTPEAFYNIDENGHAHTPGWSMEALEFLVKERKIAAIGHETLDTDAAQDAQEKGFLFAEHYVLQQHLWQAEVLNHLDQVPAVGAFIHVNFPNFEALPSFPARIVAYLP